MAARVAGDSVRDLTFKTVQGYHSRVKSAFMTAIFAGDTIALDELVTHGADVHVVVGGWNLLHRALVSVTLEVFPAVVQRLIDHGVDFRAPDAQGWTPLHFAARSKHVAGAIGAMRVLLAAVQIRTRSPMRA